MYASFVDLITFVSKSRVMLYIFVINGRADKRSIIDAELEKQLIGTSFKYDIYHTIGVGDGIRYVRIYCDLHPDDEVCFVACGGSGTVNEVASGIVGFRKKSMAIMAYEGTNDFIKYYPGRNFQSVAEIMNGETVKVDIIRVNDNYALNVINLGFDGMVAYQANRMIESGVEQKTAYRKSVMRSIIGHRVNHVRVEADGIALNRKSILLCTMANGRWCGGQFLCAPRAVVDDGLIDVCLFKTCSLISFLRILGPYEKGEHLDNRFCQRRMKYCRAKHLKLTSKYLIYICLDGEITASTEFDIDILPQAITLVLPQNNEQK